MESYGNEINSNRTLTKTRPLIFRFGKRKFIAFHDANCPQNGLEIPLRTERNCSILQEFFCSGNGD